MQPEPPPDDDDSRELLDKVDALLKRHQPKRYAETAMTQPEQTELPESPDVPVLQELLEPLETLAAMESPAEPEQPEPPPMAKSEPPEPDASAYDDIPLLTDIVEETAEAHIPADVPLPGGQLLELEDRLYRELEAHLVPQLSMAFSKALNELLAQAKTHIGVAVREHLVQELHNQTQRLEARD